MLKINWLLVATRPRHQPLIFTATDTLKEVVHTAVKQPWQVGWVLLLMMIVDLYSALRKAPLLRYVSQCMWKGMSSVLIEKIRCWVMDHVHGDDQAAGFRPSDLPRRMPNVRTFCDDDVVRSADGEWQIGDADDWQCYTIYSDKILFFSTNHTMYEEI